MHKKPKKKYILNIKNLILYFYAIFVSIIIDQNLKRISFIIYFIIITLTKCTKEAKYM
jgi:hypothetical protein